MAEDTWPEFLYGGMTITEYVQHVVTTRDPTSEVIALVELVRDYTDYPFRTPGKTFQYINLIARATRILLAQSDPRASTN